MSLNINAEVGQVITFGTYPQSDVTGVKAEPIAWKVLAVKDGKALLITEKGIDNVMFHNGNMNVTWETCDMRKWLNGEFMDKAFNAEEKAAIVTTTLQTPDSKVRGALGAGETEDKVFVLSIDEVNELFASDEDRAAKATAYAVAKGAFIHKSNDNCWFWLRSPGYYQSDAAGVNYNGFVHESGDNVSSPSDAVRPSVWVQL